MRTTTWYTVGKIRRGKHRRRWTEIERKRTWPRWRSSGAVEAHTTQRIRWLAGRWCRDLPCSPKVHNDLD